MGINSSKLRRKGLVVAENDYQVLYKYNEESSLKREYHFLAQKFGKRIGKIALVSKKQVVTLKKCIDHKNTTNLSP